MKAYSEDLRRKVLDVIERGLNKSEAARLFGVSLSSVKRYAKMAREGRPLVPRKVPGKRHKIEVRVDVNGDGVWDDKEFEVNHRQFYLAPKPDAAKS